MQFVLTNIHAYVQFNKMFLNVKYRLSKRFNLILNILICSIDIQGRCFIEHKGNSVLQHY